MVTCPALDAEFRPSRRDVLVARAVVVLLAVLVYAGSLGHGFVYDDETVVQSQEIVRSHRFAEAFTTPYHRGAGQAVETGLYRPLTILSFAVQHALHDGRPLAFHALNVALHGVASVLVLELALTLSLPILAAGGAALLFAAHPVHVEAVAGIAGRAELLSAVFYLAALLAYARRPGRSRPLFTAAFSFAALLSKETAITFPAVAFAYDLLVRREPGIGVAAFLRDRRRELTASAFAVLLPPLAYLVVRRAVLGSLLVPAASVSMIENPLVGLSLAQRLHTAVAVLGRYVALAVAPVRLSPDWGFAELVPVAAPGDPWFLLGVAAVVAAGALFGAAYRGNRALAFVLALAASTYALVSNTVVLIGVGMAERLLYLPSVGFCIALGCALAAAQRAWGVRIVAAPVILVLGAASARTVVQAAAWRDDFTLFSAAERAAPRSIKVLNNLAAELVARGRIDDAAARLRRAAALAPDHALTRVNLSGVLLKQGDLDGAEAEARAALRIEPRQPVAAAQLGAILEKRGAWEAAEAALRDAVAFDPTFVAARLDLAGLLIRRGALDEAKREIDAVLARDPDSMGARRGLAIIEERRKASAR